MRSPPGTSTGPCITVPPPASIADFRIAPAWGARALEAFPRRPKEPVNDEELWTGPVSAFAKSGFVEVHAFEPYPVLRRDLA